MKLRVRLLMAAIAFSVLCSMASLAKEKEEEEREPVGHVELNFQTDVHAGESGGTVDVTVESGNCSVDDVDFINEKEYWEGGDKPKVSVELSADSGYYFNKSGKSVFTFTGDTVKYVSSKRDEDKESVELVVSLEKLEKDEADLDVENLSWDYENGIAHWDHLDIAHIYRVRLCRGDTHSGLDDGLGSVYSVTENSFDFSDKFPKAGTYYFKVKAADSRGNAGDWQESQQIEITEELLKELQGQWIRDDKGWWYRNRDGSWTINNWQNIRSAWYFFNEEGYMKTGWISWQGKDYYCDQSGAMLYNTTTPDGIWLNEDGSAATPGR